MSEPAEAPPAEAPKEPTQYKNKYPDYKEDLGWKATAVVGQEIDGISDVDHHGTEADIKKQLGTQYDDNFFIRETPYAITRDHLGRIAKLTPIGQEHLEHRAQVMENKAAVGRRIARLEKMTKKQRTAGVVKMVTRMLKELEKDQHQYPFNPIFDGIPIDPFTNQAHYSMYPPPWTTRKPATRAEVHAWLTTVVNEYIAAEVAGPEQIEV